MKFKSPVILILLGGLVGMAAMAVLPLLAGCATPSSANPTPNTPLNPTAASFSLTVTQPQDNSITGTDRTEVKGRTNPGATVSVNEEITIADQQGNFAVTIALVEGPNILEVFASDETGNEATVTLIVNFVRGG